MVLILSPISRVVLLPVAVSTSLPISDRESFILETSSSFKRTRRSPPPISVEASFTIFFNDSRYSAEELEAIFLNSSSALVKA